MGEQRMRVSGPGGLWPTADQTVGPYYAIGMDYLGAETIVPPGTPGAITLSGTVVDGAGEIVPDAVLELWQPDPSGRIPAEPGSIVRRPGGFSGFGRTGTDDDGWFGFTTLPPAPLREGAAPFFAVAVFARGLLSVLFTRIYLPGDDAALAADPLLSRLAPERRATLVATEVDGGLQHDIRLQGERETVFLAFR
jgi:protocatechuate 3,4-dioxygenase, alpha subunit